MMLGVMLHYYNRCDADIIFNMVVMKKHVENLVGVGLRSAAHPPLLHSVLATWLFKVY